MNILQLFKNKLFYYSWKPKLSFYLIIFAVLTFFLLKMDPQTQSWNILALFMCALITDRSVLGFF
jgi:hypothetical protein